MKALVAARSDARSIEKIFVIAILLSLIGIALSTYIDHIYKVRKTEFFSQLTPMRNKAVVEYSLTGKWSSDRYLNNKSEKHYRNVPSDIKLHQILSEQGDFTMFYEILDTNNAYTEMHRLVHVDQLEPTLYWVCGYAEPRKDEITTKKNNTNVPKKLLNYHCR